MHAQKSKTGPQKTCAPLRKHFTERLSYLNASRDGGD